MKKTDVNNESSSFFHTTPYEQLVPAIATLLFLLPLSAHGGLFEPLSNREEVIFDFRAMTPTPAQEAASAEHGFGYYELNNKDYFRNETPHTGGNWHNVLSNYTGGSHASSVSYKYLDFSDGNCFHPGSCLTTTITGGTIAGGSVTSSKPGFLAGGSHGSGKAVGTYFYATVMNSTWSSNLTTNPPFPEASPTSGHYNRLSYYFLPHPETTVFGSRYPKSPHNVGPRNDISGSAHWYHHVLLNGGGWWHIQVDTHPHHINVGRNNIAPVGKNYIDNFPGFFDTISDFYIMQVPLSGYEYGPVPYKEYVSPFVFWEDAEPQNDETVLGLGVMWNKGEHYGEIGFESKYLEAASYGLYELRYSFTPITNGNWQQATPAHIREYTPFHIDARDDGIFIRPVPSRAVIWARFDLAAKSDEARLEAGETIYYGVKDIGQVDGNSPQPKRNQECLGTYYSQCGTDYAGNPDKFDYDTDQDDLLRIKRISYQTGPSLTTPPGSNTTFQILNLPALLQGGNQDKK